MEFTRHDIVSTSRGISYLLRHHPEAAGLDMDDAGWVPVAQLIENITEIGKQLDRDKLAYIVEHDEKQRYAFDETGERIRANQGHSIPVDVGLSEKIPPSILWHGSADSFSEAIEAEGLLPMRRLHVHLSDDIVLAKSVGARHGKPVIYEVDTEAMHRDGYVFMLSRNGVWLTHRVPAAYLRRLG